MDDKEKPNSINGEESRNEEIRSNNLRKDNIQPQQNAGTSGSISLPGEVEPIKINFQSKTGISKSEHSLRHIITSKEVANALKSLNINSANPNIRSINEPKNTVADENIDEERDGTSLMDLKKFIATCFKFVKDPPTVGMILDELPSQNVQVAPAITNDVIHDVPNTSCNPIQPDNIVLSQANEVLVTNSKVVEEKASKVAPDKKKTSGNVSERSEYGVAQRDSLSSIGSNVCRICMTRGRERLISPCNCKGSLANVHLTCLERWLNQVGRNHCELCGFSYPAIRTPRYTVLQALRLWFGNPRNRSHLQSDCLIFWLLSTVTAGLLAVCIVGTQYFVIEGNKFGISHRITETAMDFFMAIVLCGYSVTVYLLWKDHYVMWNRWRRANVNVRLLLSPDANPVPFVPRPRYNIV